MAKKKKKKVNPNSQEGINRNMSRGLFFKNYDLYGSEKPTETSPGTGLFQNMDKYKSVNDFVKKRRKERKPALAARLSILRKLAEVLDITHKLEEKKEKDEADRAKKKLENVVLPEVEAPETGDDLSKARHKKLLELVSENKKVWLHRFSDVRKDGAGFYILKGDNVSGKEIRPGDQLADLSLNMTPYWFVTSISGNRISLKPISPNPFATGIGAGGAKITDFDVDVYIGVHEKKRFEDIKKQLEEGAADIDTVKYILEGTVPLNMGPNGAQGGWYNPDDLYSNRGGRKGMKPKDIVTADANKLKELGFIVPIKALNGTMNSKDWGDWVSGNGTNPSATRYTPKNLDKYIDFHRKMTEKGKWKYDEESLADLRRQYDIGALEEYWNNVLEDLIRLGVTKFSEKYKHLPTNLMELTQYAQSSIERAKVKAAKKDDEYLVEGEEDTPESVLRNAFSKERRVAIRNVLKLIEMVKEDDTYIKYLHDIIKMGGTDWYANEHILHFFNITDDIEGLKLAAHTLKDPDNRRYALSFLAQHGELDTVRESLKNETNFEVIKSALRAIMEAKHGDKTIDKDEEIIEYAKNNDILNKVMSVALDPDKHYARYHGQELLGTIIKALGGFYRMKLDLNPEEMKMRDDYISAFNKIENYVNKGK